MITRHRAVLLAALALSPAACRRGAAAPAARAAASPAPQTSPADMSGAMPAPPPAPVANTAPPSTPAAPAAVPTAPVAAAPAAPAAPAQTLPSTSQTTRGIEIPGLGTIPIPTHLPSLPSLPSTRVAAQAPATAPLPPPPPGSVDANGTMTPAFLRAEARAVYAEIVAALPADHRARVAGVPLQIVEEMGEVNAVAACNRAGRRPYVAITAALLTLEGASAEARAFDALAGAAGGNQYERYVADVAAAVRARRPVAGLAPGALSGPAASDPRRLAHQRFLFDEQVAFVLGHELAHHYRGHTGCAAAAGGATMDPTDLTQVLTHTVPLFHQPLEAEADIWGVATVLDAGARRADGAWTEEGAQITIDFFGRLSSLGVEDVLLGFLRTHPPPALRRPLVDYTASEWRAGRRPGSYATGIPGLSLPVRLPVQIPTNLPWPR